MNIQEFYLTINASYDNAKSRLVTDARIEKYLKKFPAFVNILSLKQAVEENDYKSVFEISHEIKGMCLNLELTPLAKSSSELCEAVRHGEPSVDIVPLFKAVCSDYEKVVIAISEFIA